MKLNENFFRLTDKNAQLILWYSLKKPKSWSSSIIDFKFCLTCTHISILFDEFTTKIEN